MPDRVATPATRFPEQQVRAIMQGISIMEWWEREEQIDILRESLGLPPEERE